MRRLRGGQHGGCDRGVRAWRLWLAARPRRAAAADPVGGRVRRCGFGHALHRDGRADAVFRTRPRASTAPALSTDLLAIVVAVVAFCVSGMFLLFLVPDRARAQAQLRLCPTPRRSRSRRAVAPHAPAKPEIGRGSYAPLGGAGGPPRRFARHLPDRARRRHALRGGGQTWSRSTPTRTTPIIFDGTAKAVLPAADRRRRSRGSTPTGSSACTAATSSISSAWCGHQARRRQRLVELAAADHYAVPVSRSRVGWLQVARSALKTADVAITMSQRNRHSVSNPADAVACSTPDAIRACVRHSCAPPRARAVAAAARTSPHSHLPAHDRRQPAIMFAAGRTAGRT